MGSHVQLCLGLGWAIMGLPSQTQPILGSRQILTAMALFVESFGPSYVEPFGPNWMSEWKLNISPMVRQIWAATGGLRRICVQPESKRCLT